jgi:hypothetical protein
MAYFRVSHEAQLPVSKFVEQVCTLLIDSEVLCGSVGAMSSFGGKCLWVGLARQGDMPAKQDLRG